MDRQRFSYAVTAERNDLESLAALTGPHAGVPHGYALKWLAHEQVADLVRRKCPEGHVPVFARCDLLGTDAIPAEETCMLDVTVSDLAHRLGAALRLELLLRADDVEILRGEADLVFLGHSDLG